MGKQEDVRAQIIAAQAAREALANPGGIRKTPRRNWAATQPVSPPKRGLRPKK